MKVLGIIGGIGSGKSQVAQELARRAGDVSFLISGDQLGHEALKQTELRKRVIERWGQAIVTPEGEVHRKKLGTIVFRDTDERKALECIVFPYIERRIAEEIARAKRDPATRLIVLDAAVMLEAGWDRHCDCLVFVDVPRDVRLQRLAEQRGWSEREVTAREQAQWPLEDKKCRADFVIDNSGTAEQLVGQIKDRLQRLGIET